MVSKPRNTTSRGSAALASANSGAALDSANSGMLASANSGTAETFTVGANEPGATTFTVNANGFVPEIPIVHTVDTVPCTSTNGDTQATGGDPIASEGAAAVVSGDASKLSVPVSLPSSAVAKGPGSPVGRKTKSQMSTTRSLPGWHIKSAYIQGGLEAIFITTGTFADDAFIKPMVDKIMESLGSDTGPAVTKLGIMGTYYMRISLANPHKLVNKKNNYQRKCLIRLLDPGEDTTEARFEALSVIKKSLEEPAHNRFATPVFLNRTAFDLTPPGTTDSYPKLDNYLQFEDAVKVVRDLFDNVDAPGWAGNNLDAAFTYFTEGHIPYAAFHALGFPLQYVMEKSPENNGN
jgi:hypothetical protein